jgi:hypothetical protein
MLKGGFRIMKTLPVTIGAFAKLAL